MATPLNLLKDFAGGQGGGIGVYNTYPADHDSNYTDIESAFNALNTEVSNARLADSQIPADMLRSDDVSNGRYAAEDALVTRPTATTVTVSSGPIYVNGQKVIVVGATLDFTGRPADSTMFINVDINGLLRIATAGGQAFFDLVNVDWDGATLVDADVVDNIFHDGEVLNTIKHGYLQEPGTTPGVTTDVFNVDYPARLRPQLRHKGKDGVLNAAGIFAGVPDAFAMTSGLDGSSDTVMARIWGATGQILELEQSRVMVTRTSAQSIANTGSIPVEWDLLPASNTAGVAERFEPESYVASTDWQGGTGNRDIQIPNNGAYDGTYMFTCVVNMDLDQADGGFLDVSIIQTVGGTAVVARERVQTVLSGDTPTIITMSGMYDFQGGDEFQLQITHDSSVSENLNFARLTMMMVGGGV